MKMMEGNRTDGGRDMGKLYGFDVVWGDDWGHGFDEQSGYEYESPEAALEAALVALEEAEREGRVDGPAGVYVWEELGADHEDDHRGWSWNPGPHTWATLYSMQADPDVDVSGMGATSRYA